MRRHFQNTFLCTTLFKKKSYLKFMLKVISNNYEKKLRKSLSFCFGRCAPVTYSEFRIRFSYKRYQGHIKA